MGAVGTPNNAERSVVGNRVEQVASIAHAAATATEKVANWVAPHDCRLKAVYFSPAADVAGTTTDGTNLNVINCGTDGNGTTALGTLSGVGTSFALSGCFPNPIVTGLTTDLVDGQVIALELEKVASGLLIPAGTMVVVYDGG